MCFSISMKQEESAREEKLAMEKIAVILADLTSKKTAMVRDIINSSCFVLFL